jgi:hypothetical protein
VFGQVDAGADRLLACRAQRSGRRLLVFGVHLLHADRIDADLLPRLHQLGQGEQARLAVHVPLGRPLQQVLELRLGQGARDAARGHEVQAV